MSKANLDLTCGPFLKKIMFFAVPIMISGLLQFFFNAADTIVVGRFSDDGDFAVSAVGATGALIGLLVSLAIGMSNGAGVIVAQNIGAKNSDGVKKTVHSAMGISVISGVLIGSIGFIFAPSLLKLMDTPKEVLPLAVLYLRIYFAGLPVQMIYNFGSSILRAIGDTSTPLAFLSFSGVLNVGLNIVFVKFFNMSVAGVAIATVISQAVSALLVVLYMLRQKNDCKLIIKDLRLNIKAVKQILYIGVPAGFQSMIFSISNVILQSTINGFGALAMSGSAAANSLSSIVQIPVNSIHHAATTFIGQNIGAKKINQVKKLNIMLIFVAVTIGMSISSVVVGFGKGFIGLYTNTPEAIKYGVIHLTVMVSCYFIFGAMDTTVGCLRGMGVSLSPMLISIFGVCGIRLLWIWGVFPYVKTQIENSYDQYKLLFFSYGISWSITFIFLLVVLVKKYKKLKNSYT